MGNQDGFRAEGVARRVVIGIAGSAGHLHKGLRRGLPGYAGRAILMQGFSAVTAACLVIRKNTYLEVGGLDEQAFPIAFNDVDLCLRLRTRGYRNVWTPHAELYHRESASRGYDDTDAKRITLEADLLRLRQRWGGWFAHDPAYSPNLTVVREDASLAFPPRTHKPWHRGAAASHSPIAAVDGSPTNSGAYEGHGGQPT